MCHSGTWKCSNSMAHKPKRWKRSLGLLCFVICISSLNVFIHVHFASSTIDFDPCSGNIWRQKATSETQTTAKRRNRSVSFNCNALHGQLFVFQNLCFSSTFTFLQSFSLYRRHIGNFHKLKFKSVEEKPKVVHRMSLPTYEQMKHIHIHL